MGGNMQAGAVVGNNGWERFVQLSNQARIRNQGLSAGTAAQKTGSPNGIQNRNAALVSASVSNVAADVRYISSPSGLSGRILGGRFDAYA